MVLSRHLLSWVHTAAKSRNPGSKFRNAEYPQLHPPVFTLVSPATPSTPLLLSPHSMYSHTLPHQCTCTTAWRPPTSRANPKHDGPGPDPCWMLCCIVQVQELKGPVWVPGHRTISTRMGRQAQPTATRPPLAVSPPPVPHFYTAGHFGRSG